MKSSNTNIIVINIISKNKCMRRDAKNYARQ